MTDPQRGAYTPHQDAPLQFDPRSPASRRPLPMALIASCTLLLVLVAAVGLYYSRGVRADNEPPRPVGEPVATLKTAPAAGAQPADKPSDLDSAPAASDKVPVFAAAPEQPQPRPAPGAPARLTVQTVPAGDMPRTLPAAPQQAAVQAARPAPIKPPTAMAAAPVAPTPAAPAPAADAAGVRVQIGAFSSAALADRGWSDVAALMPGGMGGKGKHVEAVSKGAQTLYRTSVTGFSDRAAAAAFCDALKAKGKICFVKS